MVWLEFFVCAGLILFSGNLLSRYGDILAEKTGMGRTWIGLILLATVTSLPELGTGLSAVTVAGVPDIAAGDVLGSCVFNLMLIGFIDLLYRPAPILTQAAQGHILSASFGILLLGAVALGFLLSAQEALAWSLWIGPYTPVILLLYGVAMRMVFRYEKRRMQEFLSAQAQALQYEDIPLDKVYRKVALHAAVVVGAGLWLPFIGARIAEATGWGQTFVGNLLVAASTSLPEIVTTLAALRLGAHDLAVANLFGSNLFNMAILALDDLVYLKGPLLSDISGFHMFSVVAAVLMTAVGIAGLIYRDQKKAWGSISWEGLALLLLYLLNAYLIFSVARGVGP